MFEQEFPRLRLIDALLHQKRYDELQALTLDEAPHGLISDASLNAARCLRGPATVLYIASLCAENLEDPSAAKRWLAVYQSVGQNAVTEELAQLSPDSPLRRMVSSVIGVSDLDAMDLEHCPVRNLADWHEAAECALDFQHYDALHRMVKVLMRRRLDILAWLQFTRVLFSRQDSIRRCLQMESLAKTFVAIHSHLASHNDANMAKVRSKLALHACRTYALAGCHEEVLKTAPLASMGEDRYYGMFERARALCRLQRLPESIAVLDELVILMSRFHLKNDATPLEARPAPVAPIPFDVAHASAALVDLQHELNTVDKKAFLVSGTLLGYARERQLLSHDKDIDVGIVGWEDQFEVVQALFQSGKFEVNLDKLIGARSFHIPIVHKASHVHIDIFVYHPTGDKWVTGVDSDFGYLQQFAFTPFELKRVEFLGIDFYVPDDVDTNLSENFGAWRQSDPDYLSHLQSPATVDPGGVVYQVVGRLRALEAMSRRKHEQLRRVIQLMEQYQGRPCAMPQPSLQALKAFLEAQSEQSVLA